MESVTNAASAVSNMIWGKGEEGAEGREPVSGRQGEGTAEKPYDRGNEEGLLSPTSPSAPITPGIKEGEQQPLGTTLSDAAASAGATAQSAATQASAAVASTAAAVTAAVTGEGKDAAGVTDADKTVAADDLKDVAANAKVENAITGSVLSDEVKATDTAILAPVSADANAKESAPVAATAASTVAHTDGTATAAGTAAEGTTAKDTKEPEKKATETPTKSAAGKSVEHSPSPAGSEKGKEKKKLTDRLKEKFKSTKDKVKS